VDWTTVVLWTILWTAVGLTAAFALFITWALFTYGKHIDDVLSRKPLLIAETQPHREGGEAVEFQSADGRKLSGSYFHHSARRRRGVLMFCHEFGGDRWLFESYLGPLLAEGFDVFAFDFCNHGKSDSIPGYDPLQWTTRFEVQDAVGAIDYLTARPDADPQGLAAFGVSKGGSSAIAAAAERPCVWGVALDGAYPNHGLVVEFMKKWVGIFSTNRAIYTRLPHGFFQLMCEWGLFWMARRRRVRYVRLERSIKAVGAKPIFMIRGARDNYVLQPVIHRWFARGDSTNKEFWEVPGAKHNLCVAASEREYHSRLVAFLSKYAPMPPAEELTEWAKRDGDRQAVGERTRPQAAPSA
jgi:pimeloyl-ACP methyl ester carboxylesterase